MAKGLAALVLAMLIVPALIRAPDAAELLPDKPELIGRLERGDFEALDQRLAAFQEAFERGEISDTLVDYAFSTFMNSDLELEDRLGAWNEAMPGSFAAAAARGRYYWHLGWLTRDQSVAARTRRLALARMRGYFDLAEADFEQAIAERSGFSMAYGYLIDMAAARGDEVARAVALERGLAASPKSVIIRLRYLIGLGPRWGGSLGQIRAFIEAARQQHPDDGFLKVLDAYTDSATGLQWAREGKRKAAVQYFDRALRISSYWWYLQNRGQNFHRLRRNEEALRDIDRALEQRPQAGHLLDIRAKILRGVGRLDEALEDWRRALSYDPFDPDILLELAYALRQAKRYHEALAALDKASVHGADNTSIHDTRGRLLLYELEDPAAAIEHLKRATEIRPHRSKSPTRNSMRDNNTLRGAG